MMRTLVPFPILLVLWNVGLHGQQVIAPTPQQAGPNRGDDWSGYNIVNSFEAGYRFVTVSGNDNTYRSTENFGNGVRLFSSFLTVNSKDGHGRLFDEIVLTSQGLGGDPSSNVNLRVQKNRLYEYNLLWRHNAYFNPGLVTDGGQGQHLLDTSYDLQDHDLTLFPKSQVRVNLGYSRETQSGPGISTALLFNPAGEFDPIGNVFPLFANIKRVQNEYRLGAEFHFAGFALNIAHVWVDFKDDSSDNFSGMSSGDGFNPNTTLSLFNRVQPYHGTSPYWRGTLFRNTNLLNINARFTYTSGERAFVTNETAFGTNQFGALTDQQIVTLGNASRPVTTGNVTLTLFPTQQLSITEQFSVYNIRTAGNSAYVQYNDATETSDVLYYQYLGVRTLATGTDAVYHARPWLGLHASYEFSDRRIASSAQLAPVGTPFTTPYLQINQLNTGTVGVRVRAWKQLIILLDGELGFSTRPFTPKGDGNYSGWDARVEYRRKSLQLLATAQSDYNATSVTLSTYSSHARSYSVSAAWSPLGWLSFDASYSKLHVDTLGGIQFFAGGTFFPNQVSYYVSNLHSGTLGIQLKPLHRLDLFFGYSRIQDTGDGRTDALVSTIGPSIPAFQNAQTFPLMFQAPMARLSVSLAERLRWNVGYQYFGYHANFWSAEDYLANTGYTSLSWSF